MTELQPCPNSRRNFPGLSAFPPHLQHELLAAYRKASDELAPYPFDEETEALSVARLFAHTRLRLWSYILFAEAHSPVSGAHPEEARLEHEYIDHAARVATQAQGALTARLLALGNPVPADPATLETHYEAYLQDIPDVLHPLNLATEHAATLFRAACLRIPPEIPIRDPEDPWSYLKPGYPMPPADDSPEDATPRAEQ